MGHIFLSYSRRDKETAIRLAEKLEEKGYDVWIDLEDLPAGKRWRQKIVDAIQQADALVVVLSPNAVKSDGMRRESVLAEEENKPIFPVKIQPVTIPIDMRWTLAELQWIDLYTDFDAGFRQLLDALAEGRETSSPDAARPGPPPSSAAPDSKQGGLPTWPLIGVAIGGFVLIVVVLALTGVLPGCTPIPTPVPATPTLMLAPATATQVPSITPTNTYTPPPTVPELLHPEEGAARSVNEEIRFEWKGSLADDERYVFIIEHDNCDDSRGCSDVRWIEDGDRSYYVLPPGQWFLTESTFLEWKVVVAKADDPNATRRNKQPVNPIVTSERRAFSLTR
jgi:hypothetical protein